MVILEILGFNKDTYSEVIVTTSCNGKVNAAPIGVRMFNDRTLYFKIYRPSTTYEYIACSRECVLNITSNPRLFYTSIFDKEKLKFKRSFRVSPPRIIGANGYVECKVSSVEDFEEYSIVYCNPVHVEYESQPPKAFNRAEPAIIEALIHYSRIIPFVRKGWCNEVKHLLERIEFCRYIVEHSTCNSELLEMMDGIRVKAYEASATCLEDNR